METKKITLTIAGSDSGGGAGIQADLKTMSALGVFGVSVITSITAQNTMGVQEVYPLPLSIVRRQLISVLDDFDVAAVKIGMIGSAKIATSIANLLEEYGSQNIVLDPVMVATSGDILTQQEAVETIKTRLFPLAKVVTPNLFEAQQLLQYPVHTVEEMQMAAKDLLSLGAQSILVKGGHLSAKQMTDVFCDKNASKTLLLHGDYVETNNTHGTGCTLSSAIASLLALEYPLPMAIEKAKAYISQAILHAKHKTIGKGKGPVEHFWNCQCS